MTLSPLQTILYKKYQEKNLASLYIGNYNSNDLDPEIWVNEFISQFTTLEDHPDILKINKASTESEYKVDSKSIREFLKFINYKPLQLEKKFIFLFDAHDISLILSNKLLKVFEELSSHFCLFLMVPDNAYLLPTVLSRAIKLQIGESKKDQAPLDQLKAISTPSELMTLLKDGPQIEKKFIEEAISRCLAHSKSSPEFYLELDSLMKTLFENEMASNFNNSKSGRLTRFFP